MMHPARQAYVEEDAPEVSRQPCTSCCLGNVHANIPERRGSQTGDVCLGRSLGCQLMESLGVLGYRDGGGPREHTYGKP